MWCFSLIKITHVWTLTEVKFLIIKNSGWKRMPKTLFPSINMWFLLRFQFYEWKYTSKNTPKGGYLDKWELYCLHFSRVNHGISWTTWILSGFQFFHRIPAIQSHHMWEMGRDPGAQPTPCALRMGKLADRSEVTYPRSQSQLPIGTAVTQI